MSRTETVTTALAVAAGIAPMLLFGAAIAIRWIGDKLAARYDVPARQPLAFPESARLGNDDFRRWDV